MKLKGKNMLKNKNKFRIIRRLFDLPFKLLIIKFFLKLYYVLYNRFNLFEKKFFRYLNKKEDFFNLYFLDNYSWVLDVSFEEHYETTNNKPYLFVFWYTGFDSLPLVVDKCISSLKKHSKNYNLILLSKDNYGEYVSVDKNIENMLLSHKISIQNFSDYLRIKLLEKYNCIWVDATVYAIKDIPLDYSKWNYFSVKSENIYLNKKEYAIYPNFKFGQVYLLGGRRKRVFFQCALFFEDYLKAGKSYLDYFMIYYFINFLYKYDPADHETINSLPENNPHIEDYFYYKSVDVAKIPFCISPKDVFAKLSYKLDLSDDLNNKKTLIYNLLNGLFDS